MAPSDVPPLLGAWRGERANTNDRSTDDQVRGGLVGLNFFLRLDVAINQIGDIRILIFVFLK